MRPRRGRPGYQHHDGGASAGRHRRRRAAVARRSDGGIDPAALSHRDVKDFLARLMRLERAGKLSAYRRAQSINMVAKFLRDCREMGLTQPGAILGRLPGDVVIRRAERPRATRRDDAVGAALPDVVMSQLLSPGNLERLEILAGPTIRAAAELGAGAGRRTAELCSLRFACLDYDEHTGEDGQRRASPVLVHDMPKVLKVGSLAQQQTVRAGLPSPFPRELVIPYAFRHSFAQRHADAGTPVDTLKELLGRHGAHHARLLPGHGPPQAGSPGDARPAAAGCWRATSPA